MERVIKINVKEVLSNLSKISMSTTQGTISRPLGIGAWQVNGGS